MLSNTLFFLILNLGMEDGSAVLTFYYLFKLYLNDLYAVRDGVLDELNINNFNDLLI